MCLTSLRSHIGVVRVDFAKGVAPSKIKYFSSQTNLHALGDAVGRLVAARTAAGRAARDVLSALFVRIVLRIVAAVCVDEFQ